MAQLMDRFRTKMESMIDRLAQTNARLTSKLHTQRFGVVDPKAPGGPTYHTAMKSSWIRSYAYDPRTKTLFMTTLKGKTYSWSDIDANTAALCENGMASCRTADPTGMRRWWPDKTPSLGAAFWQHLRGKTVGAGAGAGAAKKKGQAIGYIDVDLGGHDNSSSGFDSTSGGYTYVPKGGFNNTARVGRPTKLQTTAKKFAWTAQQKKKRGGYT